MASKTILKARANEAERQRSANGGIAWDENNLGENDAYLASTTRQKIIEPKTPYNGQLGELARHASEPSRAPAPDALAYADCRGIRVRTAQTTKRSTTRRSRARSSSGGCPTRRRGGSCPAASTSARSRMRR